jgi:hypothetical protein
MGHLCGVGWMAIVCSDSVLLGASLLQAVEVLQAALDAAETLTHAPVPESTRSALDAACTDARCVYSAPSLHPCC